MAELAAEALAASRRLRNELSGSQLPRSTAQLYSQHVLLRSGSGGLAGFTEADARERLWEAVRLLEAARFSRASGESDWPAALRRAGELLEWLAHPEINVRRLPYSLVGAAAYQLAGYPARAASLARVSADQEDDAPLLRVLLSGNLNRLLADASVQASIPLEASAAANALSSGAAMDIIAARISSALGVLAAWLRWGTDDRLEEALAILREAPGAALHVADPFAWLLLRLIGDAATDLARTSLRTALRPLASEGETGERSAFELYSRLAFRAGQSQVWPSQQRGIDKLVEGESFALCTPTGSGKTRIAEVALLQGLRRQAADDAPLCIYVVPTRALAAEVEGKLNGALREASGGQAVTITGLYGGIDWGPTDQWLTGDEPTVLICTQEKAEALVRFFGEDVLARLRTVIIDEAHAIQFTERVSALEAHESRSLRLEMLVSRLKAARPDARFIAISAVAHNLAQPLGRWISSGAQQEAITVPYRSTRQVVGRLQCYPSGDTRIEYDLLDGRAIRIGSGESAPFVPRPFPQMPPTPSLDGRMQRAAAFALWAAVQLAGREGTSQTVLVSVAEQIGNHGGWWLKLLEETWRDEDLPTFFAEPQDEQRRRQFTRALDSCADLFGESSREYRLLKQGIVMHHGRMPGRLSRYITALIEQQMVRIVLATSTLSEGVNLPFQTVILPGLRRYSSNARLSGREFANLAGRAGRPGIATEGQVLAIMPGSGPSQDYRRILQEVLGASGAGPGPQSAIAVLVERVRSLFPDGGEDDLTRWLEGTAPRDVTDTENADLIDSLDSLDAVLIAAIEDSVEDEVEDALRRFWRATFAHVASAEESDLEDLFVTRGRALVSGIYPEAHDRSRIYKTSLPPREADLLFETVPRLIEHLQGGAAYALWDNEQRMSYILRAVEILGEVPKFRVRETVGASQATREDALRWWFNVPVEGGRSPTVSQVARWHDFLQQQLRYRFTWGLGSALAVASGTPESTPGEAPVPSAALWIKDLLTWGTLDPAEAYFLSRGLADTRPEAATVADAYYEEREREGVSGDPYDVAALRMWAARQVERDGPELETTRFAATVVERMNADARRRDYRVVPSPMPDGSTEWLDPSGAVLANSTPDAGIVPDPDVWDFLLRPSAGIVEVQRYV